MSPFLTRLLRGAVLGIMLLLAATANLVSFSYDADDDDDTPPITVELSIVAPVRKATQLISQQCAVRVSNAQDEAPSTDWGASSDAARLHMSPKGSPQLVIPLRT